MQLNNLKLAAGSKHAKRRVGYDIGSGLGKTAGRDRRDQKPRSSGFHKVGFEDGQISLYRRLPKHDFISLTRELTAEACLGDLADLSIEEIDPLSLKQTGLVGEMVKSAKAILSGEIDKKVTLRGINVTAGAKAAIEAVGGSLA